MKQSFFKMSAFLLVSSLFFTTSLLAQNEEKKVIEKEVIVKDNKDKKEVQEVIITRNGGGEEKMVVVVDGDKVTVNGKPLDEYKEKNGNVNIKIKKVKDPDAMLWAPKGGEEENIRYFKMDENKAMLGVVTQKVEGGIEIQEITKESAAEKAGLKENDVITKIDDKKIQDPDELSKIIQQHKPGDKVTVTYLRNKKEQKTTAELTKWKGMNFMGKSNGGEDFDIDLKGNFNMEGLDFERELPRIMAIPGMPGAPGHNWSWSGGGPRLGLSVQDTEDGKGVKVIDVDEESNAGKSGIKEDDIITEVDGKAVNNTDEITKIIKDSKEKNSVMIKLQRSGKTQNIEVRMPKKIKTADL